MGKLWLNILIYEKFEMDHINTNFVLLLSFTAWNVIVAHNPYDTAFESNGHVEQPADSNNNSGKYTIKNVRKKFA